MRDFWQRWKRLFQLIGTAAVGLSGSCAIFAHPDAPRWSIAVAGVLFSAGALAAIVVLIVLGSVLVEEVRPALRLRRPATPMFVARKNPALVGRRHYTLHPISFWGTLTFNNRFLFGFMLFDQPEHIEFREETNNGK